MTRAALLALAAVAAACHDHHHAPSEPGGHGHGHGHDDGDDPRPALAYTHWTDASELFVELPALVVGADSPLAAHVTRLADFTALTEGAVHVVLRGDGGDERFDSAAPSSPGIFRPVARPTRPGPRRLVVEVRAPGLTADHDLGEVTVFPTVDAAVAGVVEPPEVAGRIAFLKEQQWPMEFATAPAAERELRPTVRATGVVVPRAGGEVLVVAPVAGRFAARDGQPPRLGQHVSAGAPLGSVTPRLEAADAASLELAVTSATLQLRYAEKQRARLAELRRDGAVPEQRVEEAGHAEALARAELATAERRLAQLRRARQSAVRAEGVVEVRAPLSGSVTEVLVAPGAFVEAGAGLLRVTDLAEPWLEVAVPAIDVGRLGPPGGASAWFEGVEAPLELPPEAEVARGDRLEPRTQTLRVLYALDASAGRPPLGAFARVELATGAPRRALAIPQAALVDDGGVTVVFVQVEGEAFERRVVRTGARDRGLVEVLAGVAAGERVVTRGAWSVKLAAAAGALPAHGHSH